MRMRLYSIRTARICPGPEPIVHSLLREAACALPGNHKRSGSDRRDPVRVSLSEIGHERWYGRSGNKT